MSKDPFKEAPPVQEYEERKSISKEEFADLICHSNFTHLDEDGMMAVFHTLQEDETEVYKDLYHAERKRVRELETRLTKEMK